MLIKQHSRDRMRPLVLGVVAFLCAAFLALSALALVPPSPAVAADSAVAPLQVAISGQFRDFTTGQPIGGAQVTILKEDGTLAGTSVADASGEFALTVATVAGARLTAVYEAAGYLCEESLLRAWAPRLTVSPLLTPEGVEEAVLYSLTESGFAPESSAADTAVTGARYGLGAATLTPPATIRVYRTHLTPSIVQVVDFEFYCKHVLPCEWLVQWPVESLRAGAIAVKEYAWYYVSKGGKYPNSYHPSVYADVTDGWEDQWYDPTRSDPRTDAAVDDTWSSYLLKDGALFMLQYCGDSALDSNYRCPIHPTRMPQWGTQQLAALGWTWQQIIHYYWDPVSIVPSSTTVPCTTIVGSDRFDTALKLSQAMFPAASYPTGLPADSGVVLAPGWESYQEALCGAPLAAAYGGPVLLSSKTVLYSGVAAELTRLDPDHVFCIGLTGTAVADAVQGILPEAAVVTINGADVYQMSYLVAKKLGERVDATGRDISAATGIVTIGTNFPDAIGVSALACDQHWPILLTDQSDNNPMNSWAVQALDELGVTTYVKAGTYTPDPAGVAGLRNFSGADRYETCANVATWAQANAGLTFAHTALTSGDKFPDALAGGPYVALDHGQLLISPLAGPLPSYISALITANRDEVEHFTFIACVEPVISQVKALLP
ncbi:MAG: cell wall-binding repeat-containing protein [Thermoleophilia bacterium]|nr:cell wall-binding repeat-containing protein [Thermoleophilia bacterium]